MLLLRIAHVHHNLRARSAHARGSLTIITKHENGSIVMIVEKLVVLLNVTPLHQYLIL